MGSINIDNTGSGSDVTISSDGTSLLLDGTAIGGTPDLYADNYDSTSTQPSASGTNGVAVGVSSTASGIRAFSTARGTASATDSVSLGGTAGGNRSISGPYESTIGSGATGAVALGTNDASAGATIAANATGAVALGAAYASGADSFAAVIDNNTSSYGATGANSIAMGYQSKATSSYSIAIGRENIAQSNVSSSAIGGKSNIASGHYSIVAGGNINNATASRSAALGGQSNDATAQYSVVAGGLNSTASGEYSAAFGGSVNTASGHYSFAHGYYAVASQYGQEAHASGRFAASGDAQGSQFILRADTTDATATVLTTNNSTAAATNQIVAASDTCITFDGTITAMQNGAQAYASWRIEGLLVNDGGTTTLANSATTVIQNSSSWGMALSADNTNNALAITVTGEASHNIRWVANIRTTEVTYA